ncbi:dnaJ homolog subfamily C member 28 [Helicoverpa zea]|uniref:dnaJ homolog subfamily C member 28 n=1 Tax=Helicoverpa zea TaxID=7113 RepID=UPI001F587A0F|nr:dnaJ homolog subfamily C member 28 [Helicoverpa zea]
MNKKALLTSTFKHVDHVALSYFGANLISARTITSKATEKKLKECSHVLKIPLDSKQDVVRQAFLDLAKKYHPDSGSPEADMDKFVEVENAFRTLTKHNTGVSNKEEVEQVVYDIRHTAPQHRQYLSYEGYGHGTIFQRQKQYTQARAQKAAINVMEHRIEKSMATEKTLMKKGQYGKKHDIKTKYGFDRLVEDLIQESMSKGEFENLSGKGKPLNNQNNNPYVDFTTHKLNEVLINNGFTPEWITLAKEIEQEIADLKKEISSDRSPLGPYPLTEEEYSKWQIIYKHNKELASSINMKIDKYNLIVPLLNKQKFHVEFDKICDDILKNGIHSVVKPKKPENINVVKNEYLNNDSGDLFGMFSKALIDLFTFKDFKKS